MRFIFYALISASCFCYFLLTDSNITSNITSKSRIKINLCPRPWPRDDWPRPRSLWPRPHSASSAHGLVNKPEPH